MHLTDQAEVRMEELRRLRKARGLSQAKLAALADLDPSTVSQIETGARRANTRTLERLATALGAEVADLFPKGQPPLPDFEDGRLMDRPEVREWLREQGHMDQDEFLTWAEDLEFEISDDGLPEGIERGMQKLREMRDQLDKALAKSPAQNALFSRREVPKGERVKELFRQKRLAWDLKWEIRHEYLAREVALMNYGRQLFAEGKTSDYLVYVHRRDLELRQMPEAERRRLLEGAYAKAVAV
jgi:transcriptional regulator with XRE-family HTH domain